MFGRAGPDARPGSHFSDVHSMQSRYRSTFVALVLVAACGSPAEPILAEGAQRFSPPPPYQLWWDMTMECSGRRAPLSGVRWYYVPGARTVEVNGERYAGYWSSAGNAIVLAEESTLRGPLVRHEMLHSLAGTAGHPRAEFLGRCGGIVECDERCVAEAEPLPPVDATTARVGPDALEIEIAVRPQVPSPAQYGGHFALTVIARNPGGQPVVVTLPPPIDGGRPVVFEYRIEHSGGLLEGSVHAHDESVTRFAPGETKRHVFDFHRVGAEGSTLDGGVRPGTYDLRGAYGGRWAPPTTVTLSPP
jgi:hypothetical protein